MDLLLSKRCLTFGMSFQKQDEAHRLGTEFISGSVRVLVSLRWHGVGFGRQVRARGVCFENLPEAITVQETRSISSSPLPLVMSRAFSHSTTSSLLVMPFNETLSAFFAPWCLRPMFFASSLLKGMSSRWERMWVCPVQQGRDGVNTVEVG